MILSTEQAAAELGVSPSRVRRMVMAGDLVPLRPGARPLMFRLDVVIECAHRRLSGAERAHLDTLASQWRDTVADVG